MSSGAYLHKDEVHAVAKGDLKSFRYLLRFAGKEKLPVAASLAFLALQSLMGAGSARMLGILVQQGLIERNRGRVISAGIIVLSLELGAVFVAWAGRLLMNRSASRAVLEVRRTLFAHIHRLPISYFDRQPLGRTVMRLTHDVEGLEDFFSGTLARLISAGISLTIIVIAMLVTNARLGGLLIVSMIPAILLTFGVRGPVRYWNREFARRSSAINSKMAEFLNGLPVIRGFGAELWSQEKFDEVVDWHLSSAIRINVLNSWVRPTVLLFCTLPLLLLLWFGGRAALAGALPVGVLVAFVKYCERFSRPVSTLAQEVHTIQQAFASAERITVFLQQPVEDDELGKDGLLPAQNLRGAVEFRAVSMGYNADTPVLRDISFSVDAGKRIGLAGATGSGKTTTVALMARLYEFQSGEILFDGHSIRDFRRASLRDSFGYVSQDVVIFRGSLRENLCSSASLPDDEILRATAKTGLSTIMQRAQLTLDSEILDQGANLSVGERQLVALTRVLIKNPALLILDEATANIDPGYEEIIHRAVDSVMAGRTCFIIAHRIATLRNCDHILVFQKGRIMESGTDAELVKARGYYARLVAGTRDLIDEEDAAEL